MLGYDEYSLDSPDRQGKFFEAVERKYDKALQATIVLPVMQEFSVALAGFFNDGKDILDLSFHYQCEPVSGILKLDRLTVRLDDIRKEVYLRDERDLMSAAKLYQLIAIERDLHRQPMLLTEKSMSAKR